MRTAPPLAQRAVVVAIQIVVATAIVSQVFLHVVYPHARFDDEIRIMTIAISGVAAMLGAYVFSWLRGPRTRPGVTLTEAAGRLGLIVVAAAVPLVLWLAVFATTFRLGR